MFRALGKLASITAVLLVAVGLPSPLRSEPIEERKEPCLCHGRGCISSEADQYRPSPPTGRDGVFLGATVGFLVGGAFGIGAGEHSASPLDWSTWREVGLGVGIGAVFLATDRLEDDDVPLHLASTWDCRDGSSTLGKLDGAIRKSWVRGGGSPFAARNAAAKRSDMLLAGTMALPYGVVTGAGVDQVGRDLVVIAQAQLLAGVLSYAVKHSVHRPRPYAHFCSVEDSEQLCAHGSRLSFYSGHTTLAAVSATMAWQLARRRDYGNDTWVGVVGALGTLSTGYYRIAADRHYLTDVVAGLAAGVGVGLLVAHLHDPEPAHARVAESRLVSPSAAPATIALRTGGRSGTGVWLGFGSTPGGASVGLTARW